MMETTKDIFPILYSQPTVAVLELPTRAEILPKIESGALEYIDFRARVFGTGAIHNPVAFMDADMEAFALSFAGKPFLRDHEQDEIDARDGTILTSVLQDGEIVQDIRITTRRGMTDYIEGRIDRFSIGWMSEGAMCSICNGSYTRASCTHRAGQTYQTLTGEQQCLIVFVKPVGIETSAVNVPAVDGTYIEMQLQKLNLNKLETEDGLEPEAADKESEAPKTLTQAREYVGEIAKRSIFILNGEITMNLRDMLNERAGKLEAAQAFTTLADSEGRDLNEEERTAFTETLAAADELLAKIQVIGSERAALKAALEAELPTVLAVVEKPEAAPVNSNSKTRAEFNALDAMERAAFVKRGGKIE